MSTLILERPAVDRLAAELLIEAGGDHTRAAARARRLAESAEAAALDHEGAGNPVGAAELRAAARQWRCAADDLLR